MANLTVAALWPFSHTVWRLKHWGVTAHHMERVPGASETRKALQAGLEAIASSRPDLVITDLALDDGDGLALVRDICADHEGLPVLGLTMHDAPVYERRAFRAGARGYLSKAELGETLLIAIRCVLGGEKSGSPKLREGLGPE